MSLEVPLAKSASSAAKLKQKPLTNQDVLAQQQPWPSLQVKHSETNQTATLLLAYPNIAETLPPGPPFPLPSLILNRKHQNADRRTHLKRKSRSSLHH